MNSVPCERIFSKMGLVVTDLRGSLKPSKVAMVTFVASNSLHNSDEGEVLEATVNTDKEKEPGKSVVPVLSIPENTTAPASFSLPESPQTQMQRGCSLTKARRGRVGVRKVNVSSQAKSTPAIKKL
jgi:hypothetical protein